VFSAPCRNPGRRANTQGRKRLGIKVFLLLFLQKKKSLFLFFSEEKNQKTVILTLLQLPPQRVS
jgi:hypothetical protein